MCGRYDSVIAREAYPTLYRAMRLSGSNFPPRHNIAPIDQVPIVRVDPRDGTRELVMARWGLIPFWMKEKPKVPNINARAETVHKSRCSARHSRSDGAASKTLHPSADGLTRSSVARVGIPSPD